MIYQELTVTTKQSQNKYNGGVRAAAVSVGDTKFIIKSLGNLDTPNEGFFFGRVVKMRITQLLELAGVGHTSPVKQTSHIYTLALHFTSKSDW